MERDTEQRVEITNTTFGLRDVLSGTFPRLWPDRSCLDDPSRTYSASSVARLGFETKVSLD
jgi:hypothetical protein